MNPPETPRNLPHLPRHIPELGDVATIIQDNRTIVTEFLDAVAQLRGMQRRSSRKESEILRLTQENEVAAELSKENEGLRKQIEAVEAEKGTLAESLEGALSAQRTTERALLAVGGMVDTLRKVLLKIDERQPEWRDSSFGLSQDVASIEVQDIGALGHAIARNKEMIEQFLLKVRALHWECEDNNESDDSQTQLVAATSMIADLGQLIEELRRALTAVFSDDPSVPASNLSESQTSIHVPELGDLATIRSVNRELIDRYLEKLRTLIHEE